MKPLIFQAIGLPMSDENSISCRIRTVTMHKNGRKAYLEFIGVPVKGENPKYIDTRILDAGFDYCGNVSHAFYVRDDNEENDFVQLNNSHDLGHFDFTQQGILAFVNKILGFDSADNGFTELQFTEELEYPRCCLC